MLNLPCRHCLPALPNATLRITKPFTVAHSNNVQLTTLLVNSYISLHTLLINTLRTPLLLNTATLQTARLVVQRRVLLPVPRSTETSLCTLLLR